MTKPISGIYSILNTINKRRYIGKSSDIINRWNQHKMALRRGQGSIKIQLDWDKFGEKNSSLQFLSEHII